MHWLIYQISKAAQQVPEDIILQRLGYRDNDVKARQRLSRVLASDQLGLDTPCFDFRFDSRGFAQALCQVLGIEKKDAEHGIRELEEQHYNERWGFHPWIFVDTGFKRQSQPLFVLGACESFRRLSLPKGFSSLPMKEQLEQVRLRIASHMEKTDGNLLVWGKIKHYQLWYSPEEALIFDVDGNIIGECLDQPPRATLHIS